MSKTDKVSDALKKAHDAAEIVKTVSPVKGPIQTGEDAIELAQEGLSLWQKLSGLFKKKSGK